MFEEDALKTVDPEVFAAIRDEEDRQATQIILIASENTVSRAVMAASGSVMTNKYAEGYPGRRYYAGCENVDRTERLAIERAKKIFPGAEHVNVQPHSGSQANQAVQITVLQPGDALLAMNLDMGGHLSHGHPKNISGLLYKVHFYGVHRETERLDYDAIEKQALEVKPKLIICGASAYSRIIDFERFAAIAKKCGALLMADIAHVAGLVVAGLHPSPFPHADFVTTTTHKTLRGPRGGMIMCREKWAKDIDRNILPGIQGGPLCHQIAARAVAFKEAASEGFRQYARQILANCAALAKDLESRGFRIVSGGTDNHLFLLDVRPRGLTGKVAEKALEQSGIICNKNLIPYDVEKPMVTSGIRIGTATVTSRGMGLPEMVKIGAWIDRALSSPDRPDVQETVRAEVRAFAGKFPISESYV